MAVDKMFFDLMCDSDFFKATSKDVTKKEKCRFGLYKIQYTNSYVWLISYKKDESLQICMDESTKNITITVIKNNKSQKEFKFPKLSFTDSVEELLDIIFSYVQGNFDSSWYESKSKKTTKISLKESHKYNDSISLYDNLYNCNPKEMPSDYFLADLLDFAETYDRDFNKKIDELINMNCGEWFDYVIEYSPKVK